jgi:glycine/D-amino acid oxidase-like deaminating enzyme
MSVDSPMMRSVDQQAYWNLTAAGRPYAGLAGTAQADVAIVGAGIVGLTLADRLQQAGRSVAVVEALTVGAQATGRSTAKLTSLHGLLYSKLVELHGEQVARDYARANQDALEYVVQRAAEGGIDCSLERSPAYTYSASGESLDAIKREADAAGKAGLPVEFVAEVPLPFAIAGAVRLADQVQFHPRKYLDGLAALAVDAGAQIYEGTRALAIHAGNPCRVVTDRGSITAGRVVVASHLPFLDRGLFFAKAFPRQHVALAARIPQGKKPGGMFYCADSDGVSVRAYENAGGQDAAGPVLIATDRGARPGHGDIEQRYQRLADRVA